MIPDEEFVGQRFGRLVILRRAGNAKVLCKCDCGAVVERWLWNVLSGKTSSCGCYRREVSGERHRTHGMSHSYLYGVWNGMHQRCQNMNQPSYKNYGSKGVRVCEEWRTFEPFCKWALASGYRPGLQIDRIDVNGNYSPQNCRWVTRTFNMNNRRNTVWMAYNGEPVTFRDLAEMSGISRGTLYQRVKRYGWTVEEAVNTPVTVGRNQWSVANGN